MAKRMDRQERLLEKLKKSISKEIDEWKDVEVTDMSELLSIVSVEIAKITIGMLEDEAIKAGKRMRK